MTPLKPNHTESPTFVTLLTADTPGAIAVLRLWGEHSVDIANGLFTPRSGQRSLAQTEANLLRLGWLGRDEVVAVKRLDAYSKKLEVEIQGHGSPILVRSLIEQLGAAGATETDHDTYLQAHGVKWLERLAIRHLNTASATKAIKILWNQSQGALRQALDQIVQGLHEPAKSEESLAALISLNATAHWGTRLSVGFKVALAGPPNVGKSTLINALAGYNRVLVSPIPGTTRDLVDVPLTIGGWPIVMTDMAGLRDQTHDPLEAAGIALARSRQRQSDLVVSLAEAAPGQAFDTHVEHENEIKVWTKGDLTPDFLPDQPDRLVISAQSGAGLEKLMQLMIQHLISESALQNSHDCIPVIFDPAIFEPIVAAIASLEKQDTGAALSILETLLYAK